MAGHTPGPWEILYGAMEGDTHFTICGTLVNHVGVVTEYGSPAPRKWQEVQANARLIAAAPDLLAACKAALEILTFGDRTMWEDPESPYYHLGAAIAKAEGQT